MQILSKYKKQLIISISIIMVIIIIVGIYILHTTLTNINYSKSQAHLIALRTFSGTIISSNIDYDDFQIYYDLEIQNSNQEVVDVVINAKDGKIVSYEYEEEYNDIDYWRWKKYL